MAGGIVVVGGSLGGLRSAEQLRAGGFAGPITVISAEMHEPYNRPPLSKELLLGSDHFAAVRLKRRGGAEMATWRYGQSAARANLDEQTVELDDGEVLRYSGLVIATGLRSRRLRACRQLAGSHTVRTFDDAVALRRELLPGAQVVVIGAGFVGCETAASARTAGCDVTIVAPERLPLVDVVGVDLASEIRRRHESRGVSFRLGASVAAIHGANHVAAVELDGGEVLPAQVVVQAVGSIPNTGWLGGNGLDLDDGVLCDSQLRVMGAERVVAVGDVARFPNPRFDDVPRRVEHWNIAVETARQAARTLLADIAGKPAREFRPLPSFWSNQFDYRIQAYGMTGLADAVERVEGTAGVSIWEYSRAGEQVAVAGFGNTRSFMQRGLALGRPASIAV